MVFLNEEGTGFQKNIPDWAGFDEYLRKRSMTKKEWDKLPKWRKWKKGNKKYALIQLKKGTSYNDLKTGVAEIKLKKVV